MAKDLEQHLASLRGSRHNSIPKDLERALAVAGFQPDERKNKTVWQRGHLVVVLHHPHGKNVMPGAVDTVVRNIEISMIAQKPEKGDT